MKAAAIIALASLGVILPAASEEPEQPAQVIDYACDGNRVTYLALHVPPRAKESVIIVAVGRVCGDKAVRDASHRPA